MKKAKNPFGRRELKEAEDVRRIRLTTLLSEKEKEVLDSLTEGEEYSPFIRELIKEKASRSSKGEIK